MRLVKSVPLFIYIPILFSHTLLLDFNELTLKDLDELAASFKFENCVQRKGLNDVLKADAARSMA